MRKVTGTLTVLLLLALLAFAYQNREIIRVSFLVWTFDTPKALLTLSAYLLGMLSGGWLIGMIRRAA